MLKNHAHFLTFFLNSDFDNFPIVSPSMMTSPEVGCSRLFKSLIKVLLPAPENQPHQKSSLIEYLNQHDLLLTHRVFRLVSLNDLI